MSKYIEKSIFKFRKCHHDAVPRGSPLPHMLGPSIFCAISGGRGRSTHYNNPSHNSSGRATTWRSRQSTTDLCCLSPALLQPGQPGMPWNPVSAGSDLGLHIVPISTAVGSNISTPLVSAHDDLSLHVPKSIKEKIWNGEYIDISVLLIREPSSLDTCTQKLVMVNGELIIKQAQEPVKIMDVEKWTNAFIIFSNVLIAKHPEHAQGLLKYMNSIRLGASRHQGLGWKAYDAQYRLRKSTKPLSDWGTVDNELWLVYMSQQNVQLSSQPATPKVFYCYDYNLKGQCLRQVCKYENECLNDNCNGSHPSIMCHSFNTNIQHKPSIINQSDQGSQIVHIQTSLAQEPVSQHLWKIGKTPIKITHWSQVTYNDC